MLESPIKRRETREIWSQATAEQRQQMALVKGALRKNLDSDVTAETRVQEFAKRNVLKEQTPAMTLDRNHPLRGMHTLDAMQMSTRGEKDYRKLATTLAEPYAKVTALLWKDEFPVGEQMVTLLGRNMAEATQILDAAKIQMVLRDENGDTDPGWWEQAGGDSRDTDMISGMAAESLLSLTGLSKKRRGEVVSVLEAITGMHGRVEGVVDIIESGLTVDDLGKGDRQICDWRILQGAMSTGLTGNEMRAITQLNVDRATELLLLYSKDARTAQVNGLPANTLKSIANWTQTDRGFWDRDITSWLLHYAAQGKKAAARVCTKLAEGPSSGVGAIHAILREEEIPAILGGLNKYR